MKINKLMIISMVIISFLAIGAVSASENVTNDLEIADFQQTVTVDDNLNDAVAADDESEKISSPQSEAVVTEANETDVAPDTSSKNRYDWSTLYDKNTTDDSLLIVDISNAFGKNNPDNSFLVFDKNNAEKGSYAVIGLSSLLGGNSIFDTSYITLDISSILGGNKTDDSFLVLDLPSLGITSFGNSSSLIVDLTNLLSKNSSSEGSFVSMMFGKSPVKMDLSSIYVNDTLMGVNLPRLFSGNFTELASALDDFEWGLIFGRNSTTLNSLFNDLNWTGIFEGNMSSLTDRLNVSDVVSLLNMTSLTDSLNLTSLFANMSVSDLFKFNVTEMIGGLNFTDLLSNFNFTALNFTDLLSNFNFTALNFTDLLSNFNFTALNFTDLLSNFNFTALNFTDLLSNFNFTALNLTDIFANFNSSLLKSINMTGLVDNVSSLLKGFNLTDLVNNITSRLSNINMTAVVDNVTAWLGNVTSSLRKAILTPLFNATNKLLDSVKDFAQKAVNLTDYVNSLMKNSTLSGIFEKYIFNNSIIKNIIDRISGNSTAPVEVPADSIKSDNLKTYYAAKTKYSVTVMSGNNTVTSGKVVFTVNNKQYTANINSKGVATLSVKLKPGTYYVTSKYNDVLVQKKIVVKKSIITKNVSKKVKKTGKFTVKVLNTKGKAHAKQTVKIKLKGKTYKAKTNRKGIATFKLPKTLKVGKYTIKTTCKGLTVSNKLTVKR